jgi:hypothetical protein
MTVRLSVALAYPSQILARVREADRKEVWRLCDAVSVNIMDSGAEQIAKEARSQGCAVRTHSYPGNLYATGPGRPGTPAPSPELAGASTLTGEGARQRGFRDGAACIAYGAEAHEWNAEAGIWRGKVRRRGADGFPEAWFAREDASALMTAYQIGWAQSGCVRPLWDLSFLDRRKFYPNNPAEVPPALASRFRVRSVMAYSTVRGASVAQNEGYYRNRIADAARLSGGLPVNLVPGSGRVDASGHVWGDHRALESLVMNPPPELAEVSLYIAGQGGHVQLFTGNEKHPSALELFRKWRRLRGE